MEERKRNKGLLSLTTIFASFFGAAMIAGSFAYFNYKFSEYRFIDFKDFVFYEKSDIFTPKEEKYLVVFYSSKYPNAMDTLANTHLHLPIIAIDYYNQVRKNTKNTTFLRSGTKTSLQFIQRFNIYDVPSVFILKKFKKTLYKQDSMIHKLKNLKTLPKKVQSL